MESIMELKNRVDLSKLKKGDTVSIFLSERNDPELFEFLFDKDGPLIVEYIELDTGLFWIRNCDFAIDLDLITSIGISNR